MNYLNKLFKIKTADTEQSNMVESKEARLNNTKTGTITILHNSRKHF